MSGICANAWVTAQAEIKNLLVNIKTIRSNSEVTQPQRTMIYTLGTIVLATTIAVIARYLCGCGVYKYLPSAELVIPAIGVCTALYAISLIRDIKQPESAPEARPAPIVPKPWGWTATLLSLGILPALFPGEVKS